MFIQPQLRRLWNPFCAVIDANPVLQTVDLYLKHAALEGLEGWRFTQPFLKVFELKAEMTVWYF